MPVECRSRSDFAIDCDVKSGCATINIGCNMARLDVGYVSRFKVNSLPNAARPGIPTYLFSCELLTVVLCVIRTNNDACRFSGCKSICDVEFKREVSVFVFTDVFTVHPNFCVPVHCAKCQNRLFLVPCLWNRYCFAVPSDSMSRGFTIIATPFNATTSDLFRVQISILAQIIFVIRLFFFSPCCKAVPRVRHLYLCPFGAGG